MAPWTPAWLLLALVSVISLSAVTAELRICSKPNKAEDCTHLHQLSKDFRCVPVLNSLDCFEKLNAGSADLGLFTAEEALLASELQQQLQGRLRIIAEIRDKSHETEPYGFRTVVVTRSAVTNGIAGLRDKSYCHPAFGKNRYWTDPVVKALEREVLKDAVKCDNGTKLTVLEREIAGLSDFFGPSCRPGAWTTNSYVDKKLKQQYPKLCQLCDNGGACSYKTDTGAQTDALYCLKMLGGDVAYASLSATRQYFPDKPSKFQYLCKDGTTQPLTTVDPCTWVRQPWSLLIASSNNVNTVHGTLKDTLASNNLIAEKLKAVLTGYNDVISMSDTLPALADYMLKAREVEKTEEVSCNQQIAWCTTSDKERAKCQFIATAARTHGIVPPINCPIPEANTTDCLKLTRRSLAAVTVINTNDGFIARDIYNLTPVAYVEGEPLGYYYHGVIVINPSSNIKIFSDLRGKRACFPSYNGLGWMNYIKTGIKFNEFPKSSCTDSPALTSFFKSACAPGANDGTLNGNCSTVGKNLCSACSPGGTCDRDVKNPYFGEEGALKCLLADAGDVAFVDYNVFSRYVDTEDKLKNLKVLCQNGELVGVSDVDVEECAVTQVISHEVVASRRNTISYRDTMHVMEQLYEWFGNSRGVLNIFDTFRNQTGVLFPKEGIDLINVYAAQGPYTNDYKDLLTQLKHCSGCNSLNAIFSLLLLGIFLVFY